MLLSIVPCPLLEFRNVTVTRGGNAVLRDLDLTVNAGEHLAILGPNGCGKSTLIKTISRELYPLARENSRFALLGKTTWNVFDLRAHLGIVSNDLMTAATRDFTGLETVLSGYFSSIGIHPHQEITAAMRANAYSILEQLDAMHLADRFVDELSSGEARRVLIGRALVHNPDTLLLDEPSNSLDVKAAHELLAVMRHLAGQGIGILLVTHALGDIIPEIDRVVLLRKGQVFADGPKRELLTSERLSAFYGSAVDLEERHGYFHAWNGEGWQSAENATIE